MKSFIILALCVLSVLADPPFRVESGRLVRNPNFAGRIVGGHEAYPHSAPFTVTLNWSPDLELYRAVQFCSGTLIRPSWVLTAAHCWFNDGSGVEIRAGEHNIEEFDPDVQVRGLRSVAIMSYFNASIIGQFDVALYQLSTPLVINDRIQPIGLPEPDYVHRGAVRMYGWGSVSNTSTPNFPSVLQTVDKVIIPNDECEVIPWVNPELITDLIVCTGPINSNIDACEGDSGGPLVQRREDGRDELVGIISWSFSPCGFGPSVMARVSRFTEWAESIIALTPGRETNYVYLNK